MAWVLVWLLVALPRVSLTVYPKVVLAGGAVRLECRVARHPDNRYVTWGIADLTRSERTMDGENAPVIYPESIAGTRDPSVIELPSCGDWTAFCIIVDRHGEARADRQMVIVTGCE